MSCEIYGKELTVSGYTQYIVFLPLSTHKVLFCSPVDSELIQSVCTAYNKLASHYDLDYALYLLFLQLNTKRMLEYFFYQSCLLNTLLKLNTHSRIETNLADMGSFDASDRPLVLFQTYTKNRRIYCLVMVCIFSYIKYLLGGVTCHSLFVTHGLSD